MANFVYIEGADGAEFLINMDQVRIIDQIRENHIRLVFSETYTLTVHNVGAAKLLGFIGKNAVTVDGSPLPDVLTKSQK